MSDKNTYASHGDPIRLENYTDDVAECHSCGKVGRPRRLIHFAHLCQHFVALCPSCFTKCANLMAGQFLQNRRDEMEKLLIREFKRGPYIIKWEWWANNKTDPPVLIKSAYTPAGHYIGPTRWAWRLWKKYGVTEMFLRTSTSNVVSIGYSPRRKKWYGWSHRAIYGYRTRGQAARFAESVA